MINELVSAFVLGLVGGIIPGPVLTAIFTEILQSGLLKSFRIIFLALITEALVATISLIALSAFNLPEAVFRLISFIGAGILVWISTSLWKITKIDTKQKVHFSFGKIAAMILANGVLWIFWITVCVPQAIALSKQIAFGDWIFLVMVELGWLVSTAGVAIVFSQFRSLLSKPTIVPYMFKLFALTFIYFALMSAYKSIIFFASYIK